MTHLLKTILLLAGTVLVLAGCASTGASDDQEYSDMPWNTPQQWEGSTSIPGMSQGY